MPVIPGLPLPHSGLAPPRSQVSSSKKAVVEDGMGLNAVSSSRKAVFEDEMGPPAVSSSGKAVFEDEMGCRWGRSVPESVEWSVPKSVEWSVPELVEGPTGAPHSGLDLRHSGLDPESPRKSVKTPRFTHIIPFLAKKSVNQAVLHIFRPSGPKNVRNPGFLHIFPAAAAPGCPSHEQKCPSMLTKPPISPSHEQNRPRSLTNPGDLPSPPMIFCNFGEIAYLCKRKEANPEIAEFNSLRR